MGRYIDGESIRNIAREEDRDRETITRIVRSMEMEQVVREQRERLFALAPKALDALDAGLEMPNAGRLALDVLVATGVVQTTKQREASLYGDQELLARAIELLQRLEAKGVTSAADGGAGGGNSGATKPTDEASPGNSSAGNNPAGPESKPD